MGRQRDVRRKGLTKSLSIIRTMVGIVAIIYGTLLGLYFVLRSVSSLPSFAIPVYRFVYAVRGWNIEHAWIIPILLVVLGVIILYGRGKVGTRNRGHAAKKPEVLRRFWRAVRYGTRRSLIIKLLVLVAAIVVVFTVRLPAWAWLTIGVLMAATLPQILMFVIFVVIGKAIWKK